jgi:hypothetical protein
MDYRGPQEFVSTVNRVALSSQPPRHEILRAARSLQLKVYQKKLANKLGKQARLITPAFHHGRIVAPVWNFPARNLSSTSLKFDGVIQGKADAKPTCIVHSRSIASLRMQLST